MYVCFVFEFTYTVLKNQPFIFQSQISKGVGHFENRFSLAFKLKWC